MDGGGGAGVEVGEQTMKGGCAATGGECAQTAAEIGVDGGRGKEAVEQRAEIEAGAAGDDGEAADGQGDAGEGFAGETAPIAGGKGLIGVDDVEPVMRDEGALVGGGLGGANLEVAVDGDGVAADDLA